MKTQFLVTFSQSGERTLAASLIERDLREVVKGHFEGDATKVTVRHLADTQPEAPAPDLVQALRAAHKAGQRAGRMIGKDSDDAANAYANEVANAAKA